MVMTHFQENLNYLFFLGLIEIRTREPWFMRRTLYLCATRKRETARKKVVFTKPKLFSYHRYR